MKRKVLIPTKLESVARKILEKHGNYVVVQDDETALSELVAQHPDTHAIIVRSEKITAEIIDALPRLKVIARAGAGYDNIDSAHARGKGVDVMNTPGANANAVAEEVIALMLADARRLVEADISTRAGKWEKKKFMGREITGKTIGIVGLGNIGQLVARRLAGFEARLIGYDPIISQERADAVHVELMELEQVFEQADIVTLHIPENAETRGIINEALLGKMKEGATLINCARAGVLDEDALRRIKPIKKLRFLNDVYQADKEGPKSVADIADIMVPHLGASTLEANTNAARRAAEQLIDLDDKGIATFVVNRDVPEGLDESYGQLAYTITKLARHLMGPAAKLKTVETSFYGLLEPFGDWLLNPIVAALGDKSARPANYKLARQYLQDMGIEIVRRATDANKGFDNSMTIDLTGTVDANTLRRISIRGTVVESHLMLARINDFDHLYFEPRGPTVFFIYDDRPGVLGQIGISLAKAGINIEDVRNPHHKKANRSLAIMRVNKAVPEEIMSNISGLIQAQSAFYYDFGYPDQKKPELETME